MYSLRAISIIAIFLAIAVPNAHAGIYIENLSKCLAKSTSIEDRTALVQWMFSAASLHPAVQSITTVSKQQLDETNKNTAELLTRLLTHSCEPETKKAVEFEGNITIQTSFQVLGEIAGRELFSSPEVNDGMSEMGKYLNQEKLDYLTETTSR